VCERTGPRRTARLGCDNPHPCARAERSTRRRDRVQVEMRGVWASWGLVAPGAGNPRALVRPNLAFWRLGVQQRPDSGGVRPTDRSQSGAACVRTRCWTEAEIEESIVDWAGPLPLSWARRSRTSDASAMKAITPFHVVPADPAARLNWCNERIGP